MRLRDGSSGPIQPVTVGASSPSGSSDQAVSPSGTHHQPFVSGRGNYASFSHPQPRGTDGPQAGQQGAIWGGPHPHYDRNGRPDHPSLESSGHLQHPGHPPHFPLHPHKQEKKSDTSPPLPPSCSSSSSPSSARDDAVIAAATETKQQHHHHHRPAPSEHDATVIRKQSVQQHHPKANQRNREQKTETQWGPRPGSNMGGAQSRKGANSRGEESTNPMFDKPGKRVGLIKRPVLKEMRRDAGESEVGEKNVAKDKDPDSTQTSAKPDVSSTSQTSKDESGPSGKSRNGAKERAVPAKTPKDNDTAVQASGTSVPPHRRDREPSYEFHAGSSRGNRANRGRGEFYGRGRGYRGSYAGSGRGRPGSRSGRDYRSAPGAGFPHGSSGQDFKREAGSGRHVQPGSQSSNPGRARNHSETRSEGSEYEEVPKRRRQRGSETGSESAASDPAHSDKEERKGSKKGAGAENATPTSNPRNAHARVFTPRGVPSRRGRGGGAPVFRNSGAPGPSGGHRPGSGGSSQGLPGKMPTSGRKQQATNQQSVPKDQNRGSNAEKKEKPAEILSQNQGVTSGLPPAPPTGQSATENGVVQLAPLNTNPIKPANLPNPDGHGPAHRGFERPPRRRRSSRAQHQQDKPPRFRRLKQERDNAARINGGTGETHNSVQEADAANHNVLAATNSNSGHLGGGGNPNLNSHHHHHYHGNSATQHLQHRHSQAGGAKSPDVSNQNSDQANEEWETASESSDFTEFREREGGRGSGKPFASYHSHHPAGRGNSGGGGERDPTSKDSAANKRSFSSQRPGMERQNRRVGTGGGGGGGGPRGPRGPPATQGGVASNGGPNRGERRGAWSSQKNRK